jgi:hypothetical protein
MVITRACMARPSDMVPMCHLASHCVSVVTVRSSGKPGGLRQQDRGVQVVRRRLEPSRPPGAERVAHGRELLSGVGELIDPAATTRVRPPRDDLQAFELVEAFGEQAARDAGRRVLKLPERPAAEQQVADHERCQRVAKISAAPVIGQNA